MTDDYFLKNERKTTIIIVKMSVFGMTLMYLEKCLRKRL